MQKETPNQQRTLRYGYTTGACATAVSLAAATQLLCPKSTLHSIQISLPKGQQVSFQIKSCYATKQGVIAFTQKDAGDDPDVTHQAIINAEVILSKQKGIHFHAGIGVGKVTRKGLPIAVGEAAINPTPRKMIQEHLQALAAKTNYNGGFKVIIGVENGVELAKQTMNARLGIIGGLSILGTTGIVRPFSCSAYIASIHQAINVAKANKITQIAACTGSGSETMIRQHYQLKEMALIEMGDFVGAVLKHLKKKSIPKVSIVGGFGKISKLAAGNLDLHSRKSTIDLNFLAELSGAKPYLKERIIQCNTSIEALQLCNRHGIDLGNLVCKKALEVAKAYVPQSVTLEVWAIDRDNQKIGFSGSHDFFNLTV